MKRGNLKHDRRSFLKALAVLVGGTALSPALRVLPALASPSLFRIAEQRMLMGTFVGLTVLAPSRDLGQEAMGRAFEEMERQINIFSRFDDSTALSALNHDMRLKGAPGELLKVVEYCDCLHRMTSGHFDVTVAPVLELISRSNGRPDAYELREALDLVDASRLRRDGANLRFEAKGMAATLDGVAKGYIADQAASVLQDNGIEHFMVDAGGDIRVSGSSNGQRNPWRIAIEDPAKAGKYPAVVEMKSGAMATSGGYEVFFNSAKTSHHLINPETGASPQYVVSVSVQAPTVMEADALATALGLMHPREALRLVSSLPGHDCLLVTSTGARLTSSGWITWT